MATAQVKHHDYHLVDPSGWPIFGAVSAFIMAVGAITWMHHMTSAAPIIFGIGVFGVLYTMAGWWMDVIREAPLKGIEAFDPWHLPLLNTLLLLTSGTTVTWAHHALLENDRQGLKYGLILTVVLGALFTCVQAYEYSHALFGFSGNVYGATFFMATGFHGFHVLVGTIFLIVCLIRAYAGHFTPTQHLGFEFAAWYWHFVDVVWLFLFICIYVWGTGGGRLVGAEELIATYAKRGGRSGRPFCWCCAPDAAQRGSGALLIRGPSRLSSMGPGSAEQR